MSNSQTNSQDLGNILHLEHLNVEVPDYAKAVIFYLEGMNFTRDPYLKVTIAPIWVNIGVSQIHLMYRHNSPLAKGEFVNGHTGIVVPNLQQWAESLAKVVPKLRDTSFSCKLVEFEEGKHSPSFFLSSAKKYLHVICPWGNNFYVYEDSPTISFRGGLGIPYILFFAKQGTAKKIASFYKQFLGALTSHETHGETEYAKVNCGVKQQLIFQEVETLPPNQDYHICIYLANFSDVYLKAQKENLLYTKHKFEDKCETLEQALSWSQFRINKIVDPENVEDVLLSLEHEVRSLTHPYYLRPLVNRFGNIGFYSNQ